MAAFVSTYSYLYHSCTQPRGFYCTDTHANYSFNNLFICAILKTCCPKHCSNIQYWQVLPSYTCGIFFSKYTNVGILSMPYSFASSSLSIFTNAIPFESHSSSMFSSSNNTFWLFFWSLSSAWKKWDRYYKAITLNGSVADKELPVKSNALYMWSTYNWILSEDAHGWPYCNITKPHHRHWDISSIVVQFSISYMQRIPWAAA